MAPWETEILGSGIVERRLLAAALAPLAVEAGARVSVNAFGQGYLLSRPSGGRVVVGDLDAAIDRLAPPSLPVPSVLTTDTDDETARALVAVSRSRGADRHERVIDLRREGSSIRLLVAPSGVRVAVSRPEDFVDVTAALPIVSSS